MRKITGVLNISNNKRKAFHFVFLFIASFTFVYLLLSAFQERIQLDQIDYTKLAKIGYILQIYILLSLLAASFLPSYEKRRVKFILRQCAVIPFLCLGFYLSFGIDEFAFITLGLLLFWNLNNFLSAIGVHIENRALLRESLCIFFLSILTISILGQRNLEKDYWIDEYATLSVLAKSYDLKDINTVTELHNNNALHGGELQADSSPLRAVADVISSDNRPPFADLVYLLFGQAFGLHLAVLRIVSMLIATLSVILFYRLLRCETDSSMLALLFSLLLIFSGVIIRHYGVEVRNYSVNVLLCVTTLYTYRRYQKSQETRYLKIWACSLALACWTHYFMLIFSIAMGIYALSMRKHLPSRQALYLALLASFALIYALLFPALYQRLTWNPWLEDSKSIHTLSQGDFMSLLHPGLLTAFAAEQFPDAASYIPAFFSLALHYLFLISIATSILYGVTFYFYKSVRKEKDSSRKEGTPGLSSLAFYLSLFLISISIHLLLYSALKEEYKRDIFYKGSIIHLTDHIFPYYVIFSILVLTFILLYNYAKNKKESSILRQEKGSSFFAILLCFLFLSMYFVINVAGNNIYTHRNAMFLLIPVYALLACTLKEILICLGRRKFFLKLSDRLRFRLFRYGN